METSEKGFELAFAPTPESLNLMIRRGEALKPQFHIPGRNRIHLPWDEVRYLSRTAPGTVSVGLGHSRE